MRIWSEDETLDAALSGRSISRVGEGELKMAIAGLNLKSQVRTEKLANEIKAILTQPGPFVACLPRNYPGMPAEPFWRKFERPLYRPFYKLDEYGSAFITRPDVAPNIDRPDYWAKVRSLWAGKGVTLAGPGLKMLKMPEAASVRLVQCPIVQAYAEIDRIEEEIGKPSGPVFLVIGATATVLAARLARKGVWALDMGHMGHFMGAAGCYSLDRETLISAAYVEQNRKLHASAKYGVSGRLSCDDVKAFAEQLAAFGMLDYGAGQGTLKAALVEAGFKGPIEEYDPAIKGKDGRPKPADLVTCTDVLEHCEPEKLEAVLAHIYSLTKVAAFFAIATRPATKTLPDGRNAHLIIEEPAFWRAKIAAAGFYIRKEECRLGRNIKFWLSKRNA